MPPKNAEIKVFTQSSYRPWLTPVQSASLAVLSAVAAALTLASIV
jgi:hypothetical protein